MNGISSPLPFKRLQGKVAIITGGASGIGATAAELFHKNGAKVVIADVQDELGQDLANKLRSKEEEELEEGVCYIHCDVSKEDEVINLVDNTISKFGKLDIMYNNAGVLDRGFGSILDTPKSDLERLLNVNTVGGFLGAKHAARVMVPNQKGCILFTASACTEIAGLGSPAYTISKFGILGLAKSLTAELGQYGIRVNCISPYGLATGMSMKDGFDSSSIECFMTQMGNLKGEFLKTDGIANAALYLASDESSYVSGQNLVVDGGFSSVNPTIMKSYGLIK